MGSVIVDIIVSGLILGGLYSLIAIGLNLQFGVAKILNLAHGDTIIIFALITYTAFTVYQISPLLFIIPIAIAAFFLGLGLNRIMFQKIKIRARSEEILISNTLLISFGLSFIFRNIAIYIWGGGLQSYSYLSSAVNIFGSSYSFNRILAFFLAVGLSLLIYIILKKTLFGQAIRAASEDVVGAQVVGINIKKVHAVSFALGMSIAAIAGVLISMMFAINAQAGLSYTVMALIIIIIGGTGNFLGCLFAGLLVGVVEGIAGNVLGTGLRLAFNYVVLIIILLVRPQGIFGGR